MTSSSQSKKEVMVIPEEVFFFHLVNEILFLYMIIPFFFIKLDVCGSFSCFLVSIVWHMDDEFELT